MALLDRVIFNAQASGTADFVIASAVQGYQTPLAAGAQNAVTYHYAAQISDLSQWEVGTGTYNTVGPTLVRTAILFNSLGTKAKVNFSEAPIVMISALAEDFVFQPAPGNLTFYVATTGSDITGDGSLGNPFATPQHAANVANTFDWLNLYVPTIVITDAGPYTDNGLGMVVTLPALRNEGLGSFPTINFNVPCTFSVAATNGAECINVKPNGLWQFRGAKLTCDCFGTAISTAGDLSLELDLAFQDTGGNNFNGEFLTCINPQTTGQIACFQAKTWSILCPKLASFIVADQTTTPNFINNVTINLPAGGLDLSGAGGFMFQTTALALMALGSGCSFTGGPATGGAQYVVQNLSQFAAPPAILAAIPGDPKFNFIDGSAGLGDNNGRATTFNCDPFFEYHQPTTGFSITVANNTNNVILDPAATLATGTLTLPAHPQFGQIITISSSQQITSFTVLASAGQSLGGGAPTIIAKGGFFSVIYNDANTTWYFR